VKACRRAAFQNRQIACCCRVLANVTKLHGSSAGAPRDNKIIKLILYGFKNGYWILTELICVSKEIEVFHTMSRPPLQGRVEEIVIREPKPYWGSRVGDVIGNIFSGIGAAV
jgi:hypothetical protein